MVSHCAFGQRHRFSNQKLTTKSDKISELPWECEQNDLFMWTSKNYSIIVDYYSRFFEFKRLDTLKSQTIINKLKNIIVKYGIPQTPISDSERFTTFTKNIPSLTRPPALIIPN